jgi:hypothetical protein
MNNITEFVKTKERKNFPFTPDNDFYSAVEINKKRWAMLIRKEVSPTLNELENLAKFFGVSINELIEVSIKQD